MSFSRCREEVIARHAGWRPGVPALPRLAVGLVLALSASLATAADGWLSSYDEAMAAAERTGRPVLTIFTGSDWCPHCRTLEHNVLQTDTFLDWARDRVVLLMIDLPQQGISTEERRARSKVCIRYGVRVFPSALVIAPDGSKIALQTGYTGQSATTWVASIGSQLPDMPETRGRDAVFSTIHDAVATSRTARKPVLVMVSRAGDEEATTAVNSLIRDPEFEALTRDNFVVAAVPQPVEAEPTEQVGQLLAGADLPGDGVEIIVTEDGRTPLFTQSGSEPPHRVVTGLRRFLAARKTHRW
jgi:thiol-disulfide isomerase/thioredoxin